MLADTKFLGLPQPQIPFDALCGLALLCTLDISACSDNSGVVNILLSAQCPVGFIHFAPLVFPVH
jgi:hypothetical protein